MKKINCILLIDDNPADNYYHEYIINDTGLCSHVKVAVNGIEALSYLKRSMEEERTETVPKPDILFLDINMPRMDGFEFLEEYKKLNDNMRSSIKVVMLTSSPNPDERNKALVYPEVNEFHIKPLSMDMLRGILEKYF